MNNRSIQMTPEFLRQYGLSADPPPSNSLFFQLWNANIAVATSALNTAFIQGIKNGNLDPVKYGAFNVTDAYYCYEGAEDYLVAESQATDPVLRAFLLKKYNSYLKYNQTFTSIWHLRDASGVVPVPVVQAYAQFEEQVASHQLPIYMLITMIPCEFLWYWLGNQLSPAAPGNLYAPWINGNNDPSGAYAMGNFLQTYQQQNPVDVNLALQLYTQAMNFELQNFQAATQ
ncbi:MAG: hypothetical protein JNJ86_16975 [Chitinophagaceae bacterium]|nr:hypothetical protein [Chitinophagaceae bacterium]